jgi:hypothetical protein
MQRGGPVHSAPAHRRIPRIVALIGLVLVACTPGADAAGDGDLTLGFVSPADGAEVSLPLEIELESSVPLGAPETGNHHAHLFFDTDTSSDDYEMVFGTTAEVSRQLAPGEHTITASLRNADHSDAGASQQITVTVVAADGGGSTPPPPDDGGYDY